MTASVENGFYGRMYDRLYRLGYHKKPDYSHAKVLAQRSLERLRPASALDVGCSLGWTMEYFGMHGVRATGVDVSITAVTEARRLGRDARLASATELPFADRAFDLVISTDCLEHMRPEDAPQAVREVSRVAAKWIAVKINPRRDRNKLWRFVAGTHLHLTCEPVPVWLGMFEREGFKVLEADDAREEYILERVGIGG